MGRVQNGEGLSAMKLVPINAFEGKASLDINSSLTIARCLAEASQGDAKALFDLGVVFSTGSEGVACDLVEAHKWFNLAASKGHEEAAWCRADIADEMTAREIAEAQRRARQWLIEEGRHAA